MSEIIDTQIPLMNNVYKLSNHSSLLELPLKNDV